MLLLVLAVATPAFAQRIEIGEDYDLVIVPTFFFGAGAHGSQWETQIAVTGVGADDVSMPVRFFKDRFDGSCSPADGLIEQHVTREVCASYASPSGLLLYVPRELGGDRVQVDVRIRDVTRQASSAGTRIPVVRERDLRAEPFYLVRIPSDPRFRANLRLYGGVETFSATLRYINMGGSVAMEIYDTRDMNAPLVRKSIELAPPSAIDGYGLTPAFATIPDLSAEFPQLAGVREYTIRLVAGQSLASPTGEFSVWGFVTITNNETQEVTTISP